MIIPNIWKNKTCSKPPTSIVRLGKLKQLTHFTLKALFIGQANDIQTSKESCDVSQPKQLPENGPISSSHPDQLRNHPSDSHWCRPCRTADRTRFFFLRGQCREMVIQTTPSIVILVISYSPDWGYSTSIYINYTVAL